MLADLRLVVRSLAAAKAYTILVIVVLALGLGASTAIYSIVATSLFPTLGLTEPDRLVRLEATVQRTPYPWPLPLIWFRGFQESAKTLSGVAGLMSDYGNLFIDDTPVGIPLARVTADYFAVLGVRAELGRTFAAGDADPGHDNALVLGYTTWRNRFASDPSILGRELRLDGRIYRVIGVLDRHYTSAFGRAYDVYLPWSAPIGSLTQDDAGIQITTVARLAPGVSVQQAQAELRTIRPEVGTPYEFFFKQAEAVVFTLGREQPHPAMQRQRAMYQTAWSAVLFLYLIAAVNVSSLVLARAVGRRRELTVRSALGASRFEIARLVLIEAVILAGAGAIAGAATARWLLPVLFDLVPGGTAWIGAQVRLDWQLFAQLTAVALLTGVGVGSVPAWMASRVDLSAGLKDGGGAGASHRSRVWRAGIVIVEAALAVALLVATGLMARTVVALYQTKTGYDPAHKFVLSLEEPGGKDFDPAPSEARFNRIVERLALLPGVSSVASGFPVTPEFHRMTPVALPGIGGEQETTVSSTSVSNDYFTTLGLPLLQGSDFRNVLPTGPRVAVINESFSRTYFPDGDAVGRFVRFAPNDQRSIVGVVGDARSLHEEPRATVYSLSSQAPYGRAQILLRLTAAPGGSFDRAVRQAVYEAEPEVTLVSIRSLDELRMVEMANERITLALLQVLAGLALVLSVGGLFATMAYAVAQRQREFGVRAAVGASPSALRWMITRQALALVGTGIAVGIICSFGLSRLMVALLGNSSTADPLVLGAVAALMGLVGVFGSLLPASRAARTDLTELLRSD